MKLGPGEPPAGPWRVMPISDLIRLVVDADRNRHDRPWILAVDGRSGSGKSSVANMFHRSVPASAVIHTDDVAWHHSFFDWSDLLVEGILKPLRNCKAVSYRPPATGVWSAAPLWLCHFDPKAARSAALHNQRPVAPRPAEVPVASLVSRKDGTEVLHALRIALQMPEHASLPSGRAANTENVS
jgi:hypothetical protein